jgi:hypothetical protein
MLLVQTLAGALPGETLHADPTGTFDECRADVPGNFRLIFWPNGVAARYFPLRLNRSVTS